MEESVSFATALLRKLLQASTWLFLIEKHGCYQFNCNAPKETAEWMGDSKSFWINAQDAYFTVFVWFGVCSVTHNIWGERSDHAFYCGTLCCVFIDTKHTHELFH